MTAIVDALRAKYRTPQDALRALGLDEAALRRSPGKARSPVTEALTAGLKAKLAQDAELEDLIALLDALKASGQSEVETAEAAISEVKEAASGGEIEGGAEGEEAPPEDKREFVDEYEDTPEPAKENDDVAGEMTTEPGAGAPPAALNEEDDKAKDVGGEGGEAASSPGERLYALLQGKLSPEELAQVGQILAELGGSEEEATDENLIDGSTNTEDEEPLAVRNIEKEETGITKGAMDAAITAAVKRANETAKAIRDAERAVRPYVGELAMSFDSAEQVYRHALTSIGVKEAEKIHESALPVLLSMQPVPGSRQVKRETIGMDAATSEGFDKLFPNASRIVRI
jgi:hypothetical protein